MKVAARLACVGPRDFLYFGLCASGSSVMPAVGVVGCVLVAQSSSIVVGDRGGVAAIACVIISPMPTPRHLVLNIMRSSGVSFMRALLSLSGRHTSSWSASVTTAAAA